MIRSWCCLSVYFYVMFCRCAPTKNNMIYSPDHWSPLQFANCTQQQFLSSCSRRQSGRLSNGRRILITIVTWWYSWHSNYGLFGCPRFSSIRIYFCVFLFLLSQKYICDIHTYIFTLPTSNQDDKRLLTAETR